MESAKYWIKQLALEPHPEGGYFKEVYRASEAIPEQALPQRFKGERHFSTSIYFLLNQQEFSAFHRIQQDELWHFYEGSGLSVHVISSEGRYSCMQLGRKVREGERLQVIVPAGCWFGASVDDKQSYSLVGCTVAPGFDFKDFELADRQEMLDEFPEHVDLIHSLTRVS